MTSVGLSNDEETVRRIDARPTAAGDQLDRTPGKCRELIADCTVRFCEVSPAGWVKAT
jgi:hypothetical protein